MKRAKSAICVIMMMFVISACAGRTSNDSAVSMRENGAPWKNKKRPAGNPQAHFIVILR